MFFRVHARNTNETIKKIIILMCFNFKVTRGSVGFVTTLVCKRIAIQTRVHFHRNLWLLINFECNIFRVSVNIFKNLFFPIYFEYITSFQDHHCCFYYDKHLGCWLRHNFLSFFHLTLLTIRFPIPTYFFLKAYM